MESLIIRPIITEKSMQDAGRGKFTFHVAMSADKNEIRKAIEKKFKVNILSVSTLKVKGKTRRAGVRRTKFQTPSWKKAIVKLKEGQKIDLFEIGG